MSSAVDWLSLVWQVYFPASLSSMLFITSLVRRPSCFISYFSPGFRTTRPFLHSTGAPGLESSQQKTPLSPSFATRRCISRLNVTGSAVAGMTEMLLFSSPCCFCLLNDYEGCDLKLKLYEPRQTPLQDFSGFLTHFNLVVAI